MSSIIYKCPTTIADECKQVEYKLMIFEMGDND